MLLVQRRRAMRRLQLYGRPLYVRFRSRPNSREPSRKASLEGSSGNPSPVGSDSSNNRHITAIDQFIICNTPPLPLGEDELRRLYETSTSYQGSSMSHSEIKTAAKVLEKKGKKDIMKRLEGFFKEADTDKDGYLSLEELSNTLRKYGYRGSNEEIMRFFKWADKSGDARISLDEYMGVMQTSPSLTHTEATMRRVFTMFDRDGNGSIDRDELRTVFGELGKFFAEEEIQRMIDAADADQSGSLEYEEFIALVSRKGSAKRSSRH